MFKSSLLAVFSLSTTIAFAQTPAITTVTDLKDPQKYKQIPSKDLKSENSANKSDYPLSGDYYNFMSGSAIELGRGFSPYNLEAVKASPFIYDVVNKEGNGAFNTDFSVHIVFNKEQLEKVLNFDLKLEARIFSVKSNSYLNLIENTKFDRTSLCVVIKGACEYGKTSLENLQLKKEAKNIARKDPAKFNDIYGSKFPTMLRRGSAVYFVLTLTNVSDTFDRILKAGLTVSAEGIFVSGKLEMNLKEELHERKTRDELDIQILSNGGEGINRLSDIIKRLDSDPSPDAFNHMRDGLAEYFKSFDVSNAATLGHFCADYKNISPFLKDVPEEFYNVSKERCLANIITLYRDKERELERLALIQQRVDPISNYLPQEEVSKIPDYIEAIKIYQDNLRKKHFEYAKLNPKTKNFDTLEIPQMLPLPLWDFIGIHDGYIDTSGVESFEVKSFNLQQVDLNIGELKISSLINPVDIFNVTPLPAGISRSDANHIQRIIFTKSYLIQKVTRTVFFTPELSNMVHKYGSDGAEIFIVVKTRYGTSKEIRIGKVRSNLLDGNNRFFITELYPIVN